ncbi:MAG: hypothetical protein HY532_00640, partial [Chloroflexi bacterium]|nr:hypothetical protein [Chloroflexota bacterium]
MATEKSPWWRKVFSKEAKSSSKSAVTETTVAQQREQPETMEQQVSPMLKELIARQEQLLREQQHLRDSGGAAVLSREMREDAEREAASLRLRAVREGEVEAARIIAQAKEKAQEVINDANRQAQEATEAEVENIIASARQKAEIIEDRARQVAQVFLLQAREDIHGFVTGEAKESYYRLLSSLQEILSTTHDLEREWKNRSVRLWEDSAFKWEEYQAALLNSVGQGRLASASGVRSSAAQDESEHASQNVSQQVETPARLVEERVATGPAAETATPPPVFDPVAALEAMGGGRKEPDQEHPVKAEDGLKTAPFVQDGSLIGDVELVLGA